VQHNELACECVGRHRTNIPVRAVSVTLNIVAA
jgi:hypothetical protein